MKHSLQIIGNIFKTKIFFLVAALLLLLPLAAVGFFFGTQADSPHISELAFIEHSSDSSLIGSVIPASCESTPPVNHFVGDCAVPPPPAFISADCGVPVNPPGPKTISYPATARAAYYQVRVDYAGSPAPHLIQNDNYGATSFTFTPELGVSYSAWVHACNISGCSSPVSTTFNCPFPVVVDLTASPTKVDAGNRTTLSWNVTGATSCSAFGGVWSGAKTAGVGSENVNPSANTIYTLTCTGPGGTVSDSVTVFVPSGHISSTSCIIPIDGTSCNVNVVWEAFDFFGTPSITQNGVEFSTTASNPGGIPRSVTPDNRLFVLSDTGGTFSRIREAPVSCAAGSVWAGNRCFRLPEVEVNTDSELIRSGRSANLTLEIMANYELTCTLRDGGAPYVFTHPGAVTPQIYTRETRPLTSAQIIDLTCVSPLHSVVNADSQVRIDVVPTIQEI